MYVEVIASQSSDGFFLGGGHSVVVRMHVQLFSLLLGGAITEC